MFTFAHVTLQNKLLLSEIGLRTLWLTVWDWDKFGRNKFLGEVHFPLSSMNLTDPTDVWYTLQDRVSTYIVSQYSDVVSCP